MAIHALSSVGLLLSACLVAPSARAQGSTEAPEPILVGRQEYQQWSRLLAGSAELRQGERAGQDREQTVLRIIALARLLPERYGELVPAAERRELGLALYHQEVQKTYLNQVLVPQVRVTPAQVQQVFEANPDAFQRAQGVQVLELFLWAPRQLEARRAEQQDLLTAIRGQITTGEDFKAAARVHSDATSAYRGGAIGTISRGTVSEELDRVLFTGRTGLTEVVESDQGLYLFYVVRIIPGRRRSLQDAAPRIERKLRRDRFEHLRTEDWQRLVERHRLRLVPLPEQVADESIAFHLGSEDFSLSRLQLAPSLPRQELEQRIGVLATQLVYERQLGMDRIVVANPPEPAYSHALGRLLLDRAVVAEWQRRDQEALLEQARASLPMPKVERWSFDLLRVEQVASATEYFRVFELWHGAAVGDAEGSALSRLQERLEQAGITSSVERFRQVTGQSVAGLGPEIHITLQRRLQPGELSSPLHLEERGQVVVVQLLGRDLDSEAAAALREERASGQAREILRQVITEELLARREIGVEPEVAGGIGRQEG